MIAVFSEFDRPALWRSNDFPFGHLTLRLNPKKQSRIIFFLLTFSFFQRKIQAGRRGRRPLQRTIVKT